MTSRKQKAGQRALLDTLSNWREPHGGGALHESGSLKGMMVDDDGGVKLRIQPVRAHCPCCLLDLIDLRLKLLSHKHITSVHIDVTEVPDQHRWVSSINQ